MRTYFPPIDTIKQALVANPPNKLEFYKKYDVSPTWLYAFMSDGPRPAANRYEAIAKIVSYLETEKGVVFRVDGTFAQ